MLDRLATQSLGSLKRFAPAILLLSMLAIWLSTAHAVWRERDEALARARAEISGDAARLSDVAAFAFLALDRYLLELGRRYAGQPLGIDFARARDEAGELKSLLAVLQIVDPAGIVVRSERADPAAPLSIGSVPAEAGRMIALGQPIVGHAGAAWTIPLIRPIGGSQGEAASYVVGQIVADRIRELFSGYRPGDRIELRLGASGALLVAGSPGPGDKVLTSVHRAATAPLSVLVERSQSVALQEWRRESLIEATKSTGISVLLFGAFLLSRRRETSTQAVDAMSGDALRLDDGLRRAFSDGTFEWIADTDETRLSPQLRATLGLSEADGVGATKAFRSLVHPDEAAQMRDKFRAFLKSGQLLSRHRVTLRHRDGRYRGYDLRTVGVREPGGRIKRVFGSIAERPEGQTQGNESAGAASGTAFGVSRQIEDLLGSLSDGFMIVDAEERLIYCSPRIHEMYPDMAPLMVAGRSASNLAWDLMQHGIVDPGPLTPGEWVENRLNEFRSGKSSVLNRTKTGLWVLRRERRLPGGGTIAIYSDVTDFKREVLASEEHTRLLDMILDQVSQGIIVFDADGAVAYANRRFGELQDLPRRLLVPGTPRTEIARHLAQNGEFGPGEVDQIVKAAIDRLTNWPRPYFTERTHRNGMRTQSHIMDVPGGGTLISIADISQRKRHEQEIEAQRARLEAIIANAPIAIAMFDKAERLIIRNDMYVEFAASIGVQAEVGETFSNLVRKSLERRLSDPKAIEAEVARQAEVLRRPKPHLSELSYANGLIKEAYTGGLPDGGIIRFFVDVTERQRMERMKTEFVSTVSHELRTPLTSISGSLGLLAGGVAGALPEKAVSLVAIARANSDRLVRLVSDILDMEKIESGKLEFRLKTQNLAQVLRHAIETNRGYADRFGVGVELTAIDETALAHIDEDRLHQVLTNLFSNAAKFSPKGGKIEANLKAGPPGFWRIEVADHGHGIPEAFRSHVFEPFAQADGTDAKRLGGTGLGLAISKRIVERMNGQIGFETEGGAGTRFFVDLPRAEKE